jgi:hypothetical protein
MRSISAAGRDELPHDDRVDRGQRASPFRIVAEEGSGTPPAMVARTGARLDGGNMIANGVRGLTLERNPR